jgi:murein L,D-transpeptidase YafK
LPTKQLNTAVLFIKIVASCSNFSLLSWKSYLMTGVTLRAVSTVLALIVGAGSGKTAGDNKPGSVAGDNKSGSFAADQLQNQRVVEARVQKRLELKQLFRTRGLDYPAAEIFMRVFKRERQLEMWVRPTGRDNFTLLKTYDICALSDQPGPKRTRGDYQTPEGFYYIDEFNPNSEYHLSLRVNYPNDADRLRGGNALGGDIFIHGGCKTAGCMAVTNENIKEIYWLAVEARDQGQERIPVHIFPSRLSDLNLRLLSNVFSKQPSLVSFWNNLQPGYSYFEKYHKLPQVGVDAFGNYVLGGENAVASLTPTVATTFGALRVP